jgi:glycine cleavage system H protein
MSQIPDTLHYSEEHEYVNPTDDAGVFLVGITDYAQSELGDVVYVELPEVGTTLNPMDVFGTIEAVKAVSELFTPLAGEVIEVNAALEADPALVNRDPYGDGWMIRLHANDPDAVRRLLSAAEYASHVGE